MSSDRTYISFCAWWSKNNLIFYNIAYLSESFVVMHILISTKHHVFALVNKRGKGQQGNKQNPGVNLSNF